MSLLNKKTDKSLKTDSPDQCPYQWNCRAQRDCNECAVIAGPSTSRSVRRRPARDEAVYGIYNLYDNDGCLGTFATREDAEAEMARLLGEETTARRGDEIFVIRKRVGATGEATDPTWIR